MKQETLLQLKEVVLNNQLEPYHYYSYLADEEKPCLCVVGHLFVMGGATIEEVAALEEELRPTGDNDINSVLQISQDVRDWLTSIGFSVQKASDQEFLTKLQQVNDYSEDEERVQKLIEFIDGYLVD